MTTQTRPSHPSRFSVFKAIILCLLAGSACISFVGCGGDTESSTSPIGETTSSSSDEVIESSDGYAFLLTSSSEQGSSSSITPNESSSSVQSSSSEVAAVSSSSDVVAESSSSDKAESSSSETSSSSVEESSSSVESSSSEVQSSSSVVESSSSVAESSSSSENDVSSSSEYYKLSWDYLNPSISYDTIIDSRDGQVYKIVTIGNQTWMAENLNYYDTIQLPDLKQHSWCLDDQILNCERYGRYYDNPIAMDYDSSQTSQYKRYKKEDGTYDSLNVVGICPNGWRVPTRSEWLSLDSSCDVRSAQWGGKNTCGVSVYSSGYRDTVSFFRDGAYFWTASYNSLVKPSTIVFEQKKTSGIFGMFRRKGLSIRCIKDN